MFRQAVVRLTLWYLLLIMLLSGAFSVVLYNSSTSEFNSLRIRPDALLHNRVYVLVPSSPSMDQQRLKEIEDSEHNIALSLLYFNLVILLVGGGVSYLLALHTVKPIEDALEAQKRFTADASHELRTPLTAMKTEIEVALRDRSLSLEHSKELHESNLEEISKLEALSNSLLAIAKQEGRIHTPQECHLSEIIKEALDQVEKKAKARRVNIVTNFDEGTVCVDGWGLSQVLSILVENAIKYSQPGSEVDLTAKAGSKELIFLVSDRGMGINEVDLPHIFNRFYRADLSRSKEKVEGYGLGLAIAKQIVDSHKGTIDVESTPGQGSVFTVRIPLSRKE